MKAVREWAWVLWRDLTPWLNHRRRRRSVAFAEWARRTNKTPEQLSALLDDLERSSKRQRHRKPHRTR